MSKRKGFQGVDELGNLSGHNHPPVWKHRIKGCSRCAELMAGAAPRTTGYVNSLANAKRLKLKSLKCKRCGETKPISGFLEKSTNYVKPTCKRCRSATTVAWKRKAYLGIDEDTYQAMLEAQDRRCAICRSDSPGTNRSFCLDHDHLTGAVRGLLCTKCNAILDMCKDSREVLLAAIRYLEWHSRTIHADRPADA